MLSVQPRMPDCREPYARIIRAIGHFTELRTGACRDSLVAVVCRVRLIRDLASVLRDGPLS